MLTIDATLVSLLIATVVPLLVGIFTKISAPAWLKVSILIFLTAVGAAVAVSTQANGVAVLSKVTIVQFLQSVTQSVAMYYGVWKPSGVSSAINETTKSFGLDLRKPEAPAE